MRIAKLMTSFIEASLVFVILAALFIGTAKADHIPLNSVSPLKFACESAENMIRLIKSKTDTEADAIMAGAVCFRFPNTPGAAQKYIGTYLDPMRGKLFEVYEVETPDGSIYYTGANSPSEQS